MNILVVEDDESVATLVTSVLGKDGHQVSSVDSGSAALSAALMREYDLLICDLMLPDLQGTEIVRALKAQSPRLPVMVISALNAAEWEKPCEDAGATRFLQKPLDLDDLRGEVKLVEKARINLHIGFVDADTIHSTRLSKQLEALGCEVSTFADCASAQAAIEGGNSGLGLAVIDATLPGTDDLIKVAKQNDVAAFAFADTIDESMDDRLMRAGAAFMLNKPIDLDALLTQAAFMVAM